MSDDDLARLLAAVYAAPNDLEPRLVYADALIERGDPRGEYIARECRGTRATEMFQREWLGALADVVSDFRFDRGFLAAGRIGDGLVRVANDPMWSTVRSLTAVVRASETWDNDGDITATPHSGGAWHRTIDDELVEVVARWPFPALRELTLMGAAALFTDKLVTAPVMSRVEVVTIDVPDLEELEGAAAFFTRCPARVIRGKFSIPVSREHSRPMAIEVVDRQRARLFAPSDEAVVRRMRALLPPSATDVEIATL